MGLTSSSTGINALDLDFQIKKRSPFDKVVALAGNPNVGKSTVFNGLTGMKQHTGNWPGKTVASAQGYCSTAVQDYVMVDLPGTYSLMAHSAEEEVARNFICFGAPDAVAVVCDATCLERNLNLVLQTMEISENVLVCVNLMDEARRKGIKINLELLSKSLGVPVVSTIARKQRTLSGLLRALDGVTSEKNATETAFKTAYPKPIEYAISLLEPVLTEKFSQRIRPRWLAMKLLECDETLSCEIAAYLGSELFEDAELSHALGAARAFLSEQGIDNERLKDLTVSAIVSAAEGICAAVVRSTKKGYDEADRKIDRILTSKFTGYPIMLALLGFIFWLTITWANYPSQLLSTGLFWVQDKLTAAFTALNAPDWLHGILVLGMYRVLAWVVSVMLPPMAIFFPLFTLLEDAGYLPRIAYNLDKPFKRCSACGKQALTMCMGFGCNAAGIVGCRTIDSPRERLLAILTNSFVPCNGRFPTLIAILSMFIIGTAGGGFSTLLSAALLTLLILLGILMTFASTKLLSKTVLRGVPSSFTLELPPYRRPQIGKVIVRSVFDRTFFVLGRAIVVAAPAGVLIWLMANSFVGGVSILNHCAGFLDPFARFMGLDGVILMAFILGFPANEIVVPIIIMTYMAQGSILELGDLGAMRELFVANGWTAVTAICTMLFSLMHWPCSTTLLTIKKETGSWKWTGIAAALPTLAGVVICIVFAFTARLLGLG